MIWGVSKTQKSEKKAPCCPFSFPSAFFEFIKMKGHFNQIFKKYLIWVHKFWESYRDLSQAPFLILSKWKDILSKFWINISFESISFGKENGQQGAFFSNFSCFGDPKFLKKKKIGLIRLLSKNFWSGGVSKTQKSEKRHPVVHFLSQAPFLILSKWKDI